MQFSELADGQHFIETKGNHSVIYRKVAEFTDQHDARRNAKIIKAGREIYEYFLPHEDVQEPWPEERE